MTRYKKKLQNARQFCAIVFLTLFVAAAARAQTRATAPANHYRSEARSALALVPPGFPSPFANSTHATIVRDKSVSPEALAAMVETTLGGRKFPDGTAQNASAVKSPLFTVAHDATLAGDGTAASPLGISTGGVNTIHLADNAVTRSTIAGAAVTGAKIANGSVVRSLNGLSDNVNIVAGANLTITPNGNTLIVAASNPVTNVVHDGTLSGNGSTSSPLHAISIQQQVPLFLTGVDNPFGVAFPVIQTIGGPFGAGLAALGGQNGGVGVVGNGGPGGDGGHFSGGLHNGPFGSGGNGVFLEGSEGDGDGHRGGNGLITTAGGGFNGAASGNGLVALDAGSINGVRQGKAGEFLGNVTISGNLAKGGGSFKIDHPLDPENKYLYHSFVESPDMMNIYNGNITTDGNGEATVTLPDWFEALNQDFRYQLTVIGTFAQAIVAQKIKGNSFVVKTNAPNVEVSWQVTGIRHDAYANKNRIPVEEQKPEDERGLLLHPDAFNQPQEKGVQFVKLAPQIERAKAARESGKPRQ